MLPVLFKSSFFTLYAYPLFMGLAWGVGFYLTQYLFEKNKKESNKLFPLFVGFFISAWLGAKILFLAISSQEKTYLYLTNNSFWLGGGFVFYGGLVFAGLFYIFYAYVFKKFPIEETKYLAPALAFGHGIGRLGCFLAGCCYGSQCDLFWAVSMHGQLVHPVQLYEAFGLFVLGGLTLKWLREEKSNLFVVSGYLMVYSILRFVVEFFRGDGIRGIFTFNLSSSQIVSMGIFIITITMVLLLSRKNKP